MSSSRAAHSAPPARGTERAGAAPPRLDARRRAVADDWHARFSCIGRAIISHPQSPRAADAGSWACLAHRRPRSTPRRCTKARRTLVGRHDFTTFRSAHCQSDSPVKTLDRLDVSCVGEEIPSRPRRAASCIIRCARWSAASRWSAGAMGAGRYRARRWRRGTAPRWASTRRPTGSTSSRRSTPRPSISRASGRLSQPCGLAEAVSAGGEDRDQVARIGMGQHHLVAEHVMRRGEASGHRHLLFGRRSKRLATAIG